MASSAIAAFLLMVLSGLMFFLAAYRFYRSGRTRSATLIVIVTVMGLMAAAWVWRMGFKAISMSFFR
jgi:Co/Zn/Cd efflux system component